MELFETMAHRHSTRAYKPGQIPAADLEKILWAAYSAPVGGAHYENLRLTVIQNPGLLADITAAAAEAFGKPEAKPLYGAPTLILVSAKTTASANVEYANAACLVENMHLAATALGLGSVYIWGAIGPMNAKPGLLAKLDLPDGFHPVSALAVGHPADPLPSPRTFTDPYHTRIL